MTEYQARLFMEQAVASEWGKELYRGYKFMGLGWRPADHTFRAYAFMLNSPLHPCDMMYVDSEDVADWREYVNPPATGETIAANAALSLKRMIDKTHDEPGYFVPTNMRASHLTESR